MKWSLDNVYFLDPVKQTEELPESRLTRKPGQKRWVAKNDGVSVETVFHLYLCIMWLSVGGWTGFVA